jgi:DNA-binding transcriptional LysR family regulator
VRLAGAELSAAIAEICGERDGGSITIGAMPGSRPLILPRAIARFTGEYPRVRIDVVEGSWRELIDPLIDGVLDLTVGAMREAPPAGVVQTPLIVDQMAVIARAGHPLAGAANPSLETLASYPWIVGQTATPRRAQWEALFAGRELPPAPIECGSVTVVRQILRESDFLTVLSPDQVELEIAATVLSTVGSPLPDSKRTIGITTRDGWRPTTAQRRFLDLLHDAAGIPENK